MSSYGGVQSYGGLCMDAPEFSYSVGSQWDDHYGLDYAGPTSCEQRRLRASLANASLSTLASRPE